MAIDTEDKRRSAQGEVGPVPDGSLANAADRRHVAGEYRFAASDPPPGPGPAAAGSHRFSFLISD